MSDNAALRQQLDDLDTRQDEVLHELDDLNTRVESLITKCVAQRSGEAASAS